MAPKKMYVCSNCGYTSAKWYGRCPSCGQWGSLVEKTNKSSRLHSGVKDYEKPVRIDTIKWDSDKIFFRGEFSRFFGEYIVGGGIYLISGTPGIGKSTFLLQLASDLVLSGNRVIYISAEESLTQIAYRSERLSTDSRIEVSSQNDIDKIIALLEGEKPEIAIVDSIHTVFGGDLEYVMGGIQQVRYCSEKLIEVAKRLSIAIFIVAHITKSGLIAGPKTLEHMVDSVMILEGERKSDLRILKFTKNRFGPTDESMILQMMSRGLKEVKNPTLKFVEKKKLTDGVCYGVVVEGKHPIILEVQALCVQTPLAIARRVSVGFDVNRLNMLLAVVEKRLEIPMFKYDVYLNITGGIKVTSTLMDAAVIGSVLSSVKKKPPKDNVVLMSEIDLSGNLRMFESDLKIIEKLKSAGFEVLSALNVENIKQLYGMI